MPHDCSRFFFFNDTATTEIYTLSLHDALPICSQSPGFRQPPQGLSQCAWPQSAGAWKRSLRSEEHTSELQSHLNLVCRLLLEKKKNKYKSVVSSSLDYIRSTQLQQRVYPSHVS